MTHTYYMDNAASTPLCAPSLDVLTDLFTHHYANPSSGHLAGRESRAAAELFRERTGRALGWDTAGVIFTSCATESNNMLLRGIPLKRILIGGVEHSSIHKTAMALKEEGVIVDVIPVTRGGIIDIDGLRALLEEPVDLVSVMTVNNETGAGMPAAKVAAIVKEMCPGALFHTDAAQAVAPSLWPSDCSNIDFMTLSSHKFHGPKGAGILLAPPDWQHRPLLEGGGQEGGHRSGTTPLPLIGAMTVALEHTMKMRDREFQQRCEQFFTSLKKKMPSMEFNGSRDWGAYWIGNIAVPGLRGDAFARALESAGVMVSMGSACAGQQKKLSRVLNSMKVDSKKGHIRISLSYLQSASELEEAASLIAKTYNTYALV